ncbi:MAG: hypothetical protein ACREXY_07075, partial [Gammaproteobacteria bacterium]
SLNDQIGWSTLSSPYFSISLKILPMNVVYNVGRLVMYTAPVVAVFVAVLFDADAKARLGA